MITTALNPFRKFHTGLVRRWVWIAVSIIGLGLGVIAVSEAQETRDPLTWPFAANSIWNMPIGTGAQYVYAGLNTADSWAPLPDGDDEHIVLHPTAPLTNIL